VRQAKNATDSLLHYDVGYRSSYSCVKHLCTGSYTVYTVAKTICVCWCLASAFA